MQLLTKTEHISYITNKPYGNLTKETIQRKTGATMERNRIVLEGHHLAATVQDGQM